MKKYNFLLILFFIVLSVVYLVFLFSISAQNQKVEAPKTTFSQNLTYGNTGHDGNL